MDSQTVKVKLLKGTKLPSKVTRHSAGFDVFPAEKTMLKFGRQVIPLGFSLEMPTYMSAHIQARSGNSLKGLLARFSNDVETRIDADVILGLVDSDYRGEVGAIIDVKDKEAKFQDFYVTPDNAIAQMTLHFAPDVILQITDNLSETIRKDKGFGEMNGE